MTTHIQCMGFKSFFFFFNHQVVPIEDEICLWGPWVYLPQEKHETSRKQLRSWRKTRSSQSIPSNGWTEINHKLSGTASTGFCFKDLVLWLLRCWNPQLPLDTASKLDGKASSGAELMRSSPKGRDLPLQLNNPWNPLHGCINEGTGLCCEMLLVSGGENAVEGGKLLQISHGHRGRGAVGTHGRVSCSAAHLPPKPGLFVHLSASLDEGQRAQGIAGHSPQELFWENVLKREKKGSFH